MSNWEKVNPNPKGKNVGDCTVRAISLATNQGWEKVYLDLCIQGYTMADMPSSNDVWGKYLMDALKVLNPKLYSRTIERLTAVE